MLTLAFFLLLDGGASSAGLTARIRAPARERVRRVGIRIAGIVRSYVSVNLLLAALPASSPGSRSSCSESSSPFRSRSSSASSTSSR